MDIRHLEYFVEVARHKSFSKAAQITYVSQSTISKMIKDLENELGVALFNRNSKYVQLTDAGEILFSQAQHIVSLFQNITTEFESMAKLEKGKVSIGLPPITGATAFAELLGQFRQKYPNIDIVLFEYGSKKVELGIQDGSLDIGVICCPSNNENYEVIEFTQDPLWVIMHPSHPLSQYPEVDFALLADEAFVLYRKDFSLHDAIVDRCRLAGFQPKIIFETSQRELMTQIVAANLGIALLPSKICEQLDPKTIVSVPLADPQLFLQMSIIWNKRRYLSHAARLWLNFVRDHLAQIETHSLMQAADSGGNKA
ncbi:transcriptional regulator, LysR family [Thermosinus carboxydivorans Nor1]|uniref:Transcriptional regulator, LysR family n=1 Tax=Thermosinus carboxydivorans Nor1 TaxID=401526 RepID=A1HQS9_9FIRM|nr:LysR family transcriptional regulator [Thermosinus carboxydivorans]EAX47640.1 transcriptional regulator, LysR family [Thermosinus carboxydivorans Nor1]